MNRPTRTVATAICECGWTDVANGAQGRAALHHDRTGHEVRVDIIVHYGEPARPGSEQRTIDEELAGVDT